MQAAHISQTTAGTRDAVVRCPDCGHHDGLIGLGERIDHPHRWRRWATTRTHIYACRTCHAIVEVGEARGRRERPWAH